MSLSIQSSPQQQQSREQMLAKWKQDKQQQQRKKKSTESDVTRRSYVAKTPSSSASSRGRQTPVSTSSRLSTPSSSVRSTTRKTPTIGRPPRSSVKTLDSSSNKNNAAPTNTGKSLLTPAYHLQRARRVLRERNYNTTGRSTALANRKRTLADRSSPLAAKPLLLAKRSSFKSKSAATVKSECLFRVHDDAGTPMGLSISVGRSSSNSGRARPSLSPLSISGLSRCDPSPQSQAAASFKSFVSCQEEVEEDDSSPMTLSNTTVPDEHPRVQVHEHHQQSPPRADDATQNEAEVTMFFSPASRMSQVPLLQTTRQSDKKEEHLSLSTNSTTHDHAGSSTSVVAAEEKEDHVDSSTPISIKERCHHQADHEDDVDPSPSVDEQQSSQQVVYQQIGSIPTSGSEQQSPHQLHDHVDASPTSVKEDQSPNVSFSPNGYEQHPPHHMDHAISNSPSVVEPQSSHQMDHVCSSSHGVDEQHSPHKMDHVSISSPSVDEQYSPRQRDHVRTSSPNIDEQQSPEQRDHVSNSSPSVDEQQSPHQLCFFFDDESSVADGKSKLGARKSSLPTVPESDTAPKFFFAEDMSPVSELRSRISSFAVPQARNDHEADDGTAQQMQLSSGSRPIFSFEDDSLGATSTEEILPRRRRTDGHFLLLPTPSPCDPVSEDSLQPSPTSAFSKVAASPAPEIDEPLLEEDASQSLLHPSSTSAFSRVVSPRENSKVEQSSEVDESLLTSPAHLSTRASLDRAVFVAPEVTEAEQSISLANPLLPPMSAFSKVPSSQETPILANSVVQDIHEPLLCEDPSHASAPSVLQSAEQDFHEPLPCEDASLASARSMLTEDVVFEEPILEEEEPPVSRDEGHTVDGDDESVVQLLLDPIIVHGKHILEPVVDTPSSQRSSQTPLKTKYRAVLVENTTLHNRLSSIRKDYEERVTPFRDVFEDERKLRAQNKQLQTVNDKIQAQNQQLRKQKEDVDTMVAHLQTQMMTSLQAAIQNSNQLKQALAEANAKIESLEEELLEAREE